MQSLSNGEQRVVVEGTNVRQIIESLDQKYPGFKDRIVENGKVKPNISVAIDGEITPLGMIEKVSEQSEVHFLPAISGG
jgi:molybdopterin synthase sulfur carrier subunit